jgi:hypothetical protein
MQRVGKRFLVPILLFFSIGAVAQTQSTNDSAVTAQPIPATMPSSHDAQWNEPAALFMIHSQNKGLLDRAFMKRVNADLVLTHAVMACDPLANNCFSGLVCCDCTGIPSCTSAAECSFICRM